MHHINGIQLQISYLLTKKQSSDYTISWSLETMSWQITASSRRLVTYDLFTIVDKLNHKNRENNIRSHVKQGLTCAIIGNINTIKAKDNIRRLKASRFRSSWLNPSYTNPLLVRFHSHCLAEIRIFHFLPFYTKYRETCKIKLANHIQLDPEEHRCKRTTHYIVKCTIWKTMKMIPIIIDMKRIPTHEKNDNQAKKNNQSMSLKG